MGVVALPNLQPQGPVVTDEWQQRSLTGRFASPLNNFTRTLERPGTAWAVRLRYANLNAANRGMMQGFLTSCRGSAQRFYVPTLYTNRGSFPASDIAQTAVGLMFTGWVGGGTPAVTLTAHDITMRMNQNGATIYPQAAKAIATVQYAPYAFRSILHAGMGIAGPLNSQINDGGTAQGDGLSPAPASVVMNSTVGNLVMYRHNNGVSDGVAGDYFVTSYVSAARCALVDNGPNILVRSDEFNDSAWTKDDVTVGTNAAVAPDGTTTADSMIEAANSNPHQIRQSGVAISASVLDYAFTVCVKAGARSWVRVQMNTAGASAQIYANVSAGTLGSVVTAGNFTNARAFIAPMGNGWYKISLVARKNSADATISAFLVGAEADVDTTYAGDGATAGLYFWRATIAQSSVPTRLVQTTSAATTGTSQAGAGAVYLKGLPVSTLGLLVVGDMTELALPSSRSQVLKARSALHSDAAGLGYFEVEAPLRYAPDDSAPLIVQKPMVRMLLEENTVSWAEHDGEFCDLEFSAVEDVT